MNVFFTCKNTLVILLQLYRLCVVQSESKARRRRRKIHRQKQYYVSVVSHPDSYGCKSRNKRKMNYDDEYFEEKKKRKKYQTYSSDEDSEEEDYERYESPGRKIVRFGVRIF